MTPQRIVGTILRTAGLILCCWIAVHLPMPILSLIGFGAVAVVLFVGASELGG